MRKLSKHFLILILCTIISLQSFISVEAATSTQEDILSKQEISNLLGVDDIDVPTPEEFNYIQQNLSYILEVESIDEFTERVNELGIEKWVKLSDNIINTEDDTSQTDVLPRLAIPFTFTADFVNRTITDTMFKVSLEFCNNLYPAQVVPQCGGYVYYEYELATGDKVTIPDFVNETYIRPNATLIVKNYSYQHNNRPAKYTGEFIINLGGGIAPYKFTVNEAKKY